MENMDVLYIIYSHVFTSIKSRIYEGLHIGSKRRHHPPSFRSRELDVFFTDFYQRLIRS